MASQARHVRIGVMGEHIAAKHLLRKGFVLRETNYRKKWGEIDVIVEKAGIVHFVEVKTVSCEPCVGHRYRDTWLPEENVDDRKLRRMYRAIETWIAEYAYEGPWQIDVVSVRVNLKDRTGTIKVIENVVKDT